MSIKFQDYKLRSHRSARPDDDVLYLRATMRVTSLAEFARVIAALRSLEEDSQTVIVSSGSVAPAEVNLGSQKCDPTEAPAPPKDEIAKKREQKKAKEAKAAEPTPPKAEEPPPGSEQDDDEDEEPAPAQDGKDAASAIVETKEPAVKPKAKFTPKMTDPDARFSDVVVELHKQGFHDPKDIAALCEKVHEKVPAVKKVKVEELAKRVERVFEIEGLA